MESTSAAHRTIFLLLAGLGAAKVLGQLPGPAHSEQPRVVELRQNDNAAVVESWTRNQKRQYAHDPQTFVRPGLRANRPKQTVEFWVETTGIAQTAPVEFLVIGPSSGHDYEALFISFAKPSHIHQGLEFIGIPAGKSTDFEALRQWPRGERVCVSVAWEPTDPGKEPSDSPSSVPFESMTAFVTDHRSDGPLASGCFLFNGSQWMPNRDPQQTNLVYAADIWEPMSIVATFNLSSTVLHMVDALDQSPSYGLFTASDAFPETGGRLARVRLAPQLLDGSSQLVDLTLRILPPTGGEATPAPKLVQVALIDDRNVTLQEGSLLEIMAECERFRAAEKDVYVTIDPSEDLSLNTLRTFYAALDRFNGPHGIRIEPPLPDDLHFRAFLPPPAWADRSRRPMQPWELHLGKHAEDDGITATLIHLAANDPPSNRSFPTETPAHMMDRMMTHANRAPALIVFAPGDLTYGELMEFAGPASSLHPYVHVYLETSQP